jgi:hypothetical protein
MQKLKVAALCAALVGYTFGSVAQGEVPEDVMEVQRCIWRCMEATGSKRPAYPRCVSRNCNDKPASKKKSAPTKSKSSNQSDAPTWVFGDHPVLGRSAYIETPDGAIGLACAYFGDSLAVGNIIALRVTPGLARGKELAVMFDPTFSAGDITLQTKGAYLEHLDNTCSTYVEDFKRSKSLLLLIHGKYSRFDRTSGKMVITIVQDGREIEVRSAEEVRQKLRFKTLPLDGSSAAIDRLIASCKAAQRDIESRCGAD